MAKPKLTEEQRRDIARRLAAGETHPVIAAAVGCSIPNVAYHARRQKPAIAVVKETLRVDAITLGLRERSARVDELIALYTEVRDDLKQGAYGVDVKISATGKTVEVPSFKAQQFATARGLLDDIAKEEGGRKTKFEASGPDDTPLVFTIKVDRTRENK